MNQNNHECFYQVGGSLTVSSPSYVVRQADRELDKALELSEFCYVLNTRQMGKSSLRVRAIEKLQGSGTVCISIDLTGMGTQNLTPEKWYAGVLRSIFSACGFKFDWRSWWREKRDLFTPVQRLALFIEEVLLVEVTANIVIFVDEIDRVLSQKFPLDDFLALIHSCYQKRSINSDYYRLTFVLLGVAAPKDLIRDKNQSPFEIGKAIALEGFKLKEATPLIEGLTGIANPKQILEEILYWTGGQPFLTQKLCQLVAKAENKSATDLVANLVERYIINNWEVQDEPEHLRTIRDRLLYRNSAKTIRLLSLYQNVLQPEVLRLSRSKQVDLDLSLEQMELRLSGLVVEKKGSLTINNPIYAKIFDRVWIDKQLEKLRPYERAISNWLKSDCQNQSYLLQGQELQEVLTWSLNKSLGDVDYQFLVASQNLAKQKAENTLVAVETASKLLAKTRKKARQKANKQRLAKSKLSAIAFVLTGLIILVRYTGILQSWEWNLFDRFFRWRVTDKQETRIAVVTVDERDLKTVGRWPIDDRTLAKAIRNLQSQQPQAIAIDIYRDLPIEQNRELLQLLNNYSNLYVVEKVVGEAVSAPDITPKQIGFSDQVLDSDGKIRRALLTLNADDGQLHFSLGTQLALNYLDKKGIKLEPLDRDRNRLGNAIFRRFQSYDGGYVLADSGGYQILFNYWGTTANFLRYSLTQVLNNQIAARDIRDRLIFVGMTAESVKDSFYTPYSHGWFNSPEKMPGVYVHANLASQIIGAAIDNRPLLRTHSKLSESLWILLWGIVGAIIAWRLHLAIAIISAVSFASAIAIGISYLAFLSGWWLPLIPSLLTLNLTALAVIIVSSRQRERSRFQYTLNLLLQESNPIVRKIALGYYKQSENKENQILIERNSLTVNRPKNIADSSY